MKEDRKHRERAIHLDSQLKSGQQLASSLLCPQSRTSGLYQPINNIHVPTMLPCVTMVERRGH